MYKNTKMWLNNSPKIHKSGKIKGKEDYLKFNVYEKFSLQFLFTLESYGFFFFLVLIKMLRYGYYIFCEWNLCKLKSCKTILFGMNDIWTEYQTFMNIVKKMYETCMIQENIECGAKYSPNGTKKYFGMWTSLEPVVSF